HPNEIVIPLRRNLGPGPYAVTWAEIDVADGHLIKGAFVFAIRSGLPPVPSVVAPQSGSEPPLSAVVSRWLLLSGLLVAAGAVVFDVLVRRRSADRRVLAPALAVATLGAVLSVVLQPGEASTRFGHWTLIGAAVAAVATASALVPRLLVPAQVLAVVLLGLPTA